MQVAIGLYPGFTCLDAIGPYEVLRKHPLVLARLAREHCLAGVEAARRGLATVRAELADAVPPDAIEATIGAYEREGARLSRAAQ